MIVNSVLERKNKFGSTWASFLSARDARLSVLTATTFSASAVSMTIYSRSLIKKEKPCAASVTKSQFELHKFIR